jgi:hypothetical protein
MRQGDGTQEKYSVFGLESRFTGSRLRAKDGELGSDTVPAGGKQLGGIDCGLNCGREAPEGSTFFGQAFHRCDVDPVGKTAGLLPAFQEQLEALVRPVFIGWAIIDDRNLLPWHSVR